MNKKILLNNKEVQFNPTYLPCLIHGADHAGASLFTVTMMADLFRQGEKIIFISGYHMARDEFLSQTQAEGDMIYLENEIQIQGAANKKVIFLQKDNIGIFSSLVSSLPDLVERIILIKNIDLFDQSIFDYVKDHPKLILSGDIDRCVYKEEVLKITFKTTIFFSIPQTSVGITIPELQKYHGHFKGVHESGEVRIAQGG